MELLDQIGLADDILQQCSAVKASAAYDKNGQEVFGRGWSFLEDIQDTRWNFATVLRQKYVEGILRRRLAEMGVFVKAPASFRSLDINELIPKGQHRVTATIFDGTTQQAYRMKARYVIGADGSRTVVREAAGIESVGDRTEDKWVRIDGVLKHTNMPKPYCYGALESPVYGNVLWIPLDHGATRIGFAFNEERRKRYAELNQEAFIAEAKLSVAPFEIEYERVDWASIYSVGQRVARRFFAHGCVFLAGDACHTHSSGAGQGMNAGVNDAVNLAWKLSLVLRGLAKFELLETYDEERRPNAEKLIKYDEDISVLVTGRLPSSWNGDAGADPNVVLGRLLQEARGFNTGLTISYSQNILNTNAPTKTTLPEDLSFPASSIPTPPIPGYRAPDVALAIPALLEHTRLQKQTPNRATFYILIFSGEVSKTAPRVRVLKDILAGSLPSSTPSKLPIEYLTISSTSAASTFTLFNAEPLGRTFFDNDGSAHKRYGVGVYDGAVVVVRPDGWIGTRIDLREPENVVRWLESYFGGILVW
ncbi:MAG: hypothetical protein Q9227_003425 [Pyrenula ochraceoflavens]